ncbi:hypothetical protein DMUE_1918 [Dictyocoela muelleri]|nr:hypothetical protein DMUE_1918 [Dictyocoela muelleri]
MLEPLFAEQKLERFNILKEKDIYLMFDENTGVNSRYILNILGKIRSKSSRSKSYLKCTVELSKNNSEIVSQEIIDLMLELYDGKINYTKLRLIVSDPAPYAVKALNYLKCSFPDFKHIKCAVHMLHRLCEKIKDIPPLSNLINS